MEKNCNLQEQAKLRLSLRDSMVLLVAGDIFLLALSIVISHISWQYYDAWRFPLHISPQLPVLWWLIIPWILISIISNSYSSENLRRLGTSLKPPLRTTVLAVMVYLILYFILPRQMLPRFVIVFFAILSGTLLILWRLLHFKIFSHPRLAHKVWIIGDTAGITACQRLIQLDTLHYQVAGISLETYSSMSFSLSPPCVFSLEMPSSLPSLEFSANFATTSLPTDSELFGLDSIIWAKPSSPTLATLQFLQHCREMGIPILPLPVFYEMLMKRTPIKWLQGGYLFFLPLQDAEWSGFYPILKRVVDLTCVLLGSIIFIVCFPFIAIGIKLTSRGPLFFSQLRVGKHGQIFRLWKFRTMIENAETKGAMWTQNEDDRITLAGKILRKLHLDELPQLWNLLKGDIAVVGVRPLSVTQCQQFQEKIPFHNLRHLVKPGLTAWSVVNYKHVNDLEGAEVRLEYDIYYVKHQCLWLDLLIIFRTVWTMLTLNGL